MEEDIIEEVLLRLPVKPLIRCKCLSKKWHHFISQNPSSFRQNYFSRRKVTTTPHMLGFFFNLSRSKKVNEPVRFLPTSTQGVELKNGRAHDHTISFLRLRARRHQSFHIKASSSGFLLCSRQGFYPMDYLICNPVTKQWITLPKPNTTSQIVYHGLSFQDCSSYSSFDLTTNYIVVRATCQEEHMRQPSNTVTMEIFSPELHEWKVCILSCASQFYLACDYFPGMVRAGGEVAFYWLALEQSSRCVLRFDPRKEHLDLIKLPEQTHLLDGGGGCRGHGFGQSDGLILYSQHDGAHMKIWSLDDEKREWFLKQKASLEIPLQQLWKITGCPNEGFCITDFHPTNPQVMFIYTYNKLVLYDMENSSIELICDFSARGWTSNYLLFTYVWPHWPPFPI